MYTGIIRHLGLIQSLTLVADGAKLVLEAPELITPDLQLGDSIAVNGTCLTVVRITVTTLDFDLCAETLEKTAFKSLQAGMRVNLERTLQFNQHLDGHLLRGHVDGVGIIQDLVKDPLTWWLSIKVPGDLVRYLAAKGSIAIDGVSLTIVSCEDGILTVALIPKTVEMTIAQFYTIGSPVNLEIDILARYVIRYLENRP